jgi:predicted lysophospholipase L1 biosynthesis ABC-type transport system permease subunit
MIISESAAKRFWPTESAIGRRIRPMSDKEWRTIVGVVADVAQYSLTGFPSWVDGAQYLPLAQALPRVAQSIQLTMFIESAQPQALVATLPFTVRRHFADVAISGIRSLEGIRSESVADQRSTAWLLGLFAALGMLLGVAGVHGVIAHRAAQRTREIGIRMVMGATAGKVIGLVVRETLLVSFAGCAAGIAGAFGLSHFLQSLLFGVTAHDTVAFAIFPVVLLVAAVLAAWIPASRASRIDPALTLREE